MKKLFLLTAIVLIAAVCSGQTLQKGNLVGIHFVELKLKPDVTYNQWKDLLLKTWIPKYEEIMQGDVKFYLVEGIRGENKNEIGFIYLFKTEAARNKYNNDDGTPTDYGKKQFEKLNSIMEDFNKLQNSITTTYTDWIVQ